MKFKEAIKKADELFKTNDFVYIFEVKKLTNINNPEYIVSLSENIVITRDSIGGLIKIYRKK